MLGVRLGVGVALRLGAGCGILSVGGKVLDLGGGLGVGEVGLVFWD